MELAQVRLEPEEESGHFPSHNLRLKPQGLVETVGDLVEVRVHGLLLGRRLFLIDRSSSRGLQLFREVFALKIAIWDVTFPLPHVGH